MKRGFAGVALVGTKTPSNVGGAMRACGCYAADFMVLAGVRVRSLSSISSDTQKAWRHIPLIQVVDPFDALPYGAQAVAIEIVPGARSLPEFQHPERAMYIFGPEDGSIPPEILKKCSHVVSVPTRYCMNLAATVNVVLYDREAKSCR